MLDLAYGPNWRTLIIVNVLLVFKLMLNSNITTYYRVRRKAYAAPEDYTAKQLSAAEQDDADVERTRRAHLNDLENVVPFMLLSVLALLVRPSPWLYASLLWGFLGARTAYTIFYLRALTPHRSIAFGVGALLMFVLGLVCLHGVL